MNIARILRACRSDVVRILCSSIAAFLILSVGDRTLIVSEYGSSVVALAFISLVAGAAHWAVLILTRKLLQQAYDMTPGTCPMPSTMRKMACYFVASSTVLGAVTGLLIGYTGLHLLIFALSFGVLTFVFSVASNFVNSRVSGQ
jgi:hypothetical protein